MRATLIVAAGGMGLRFRKGLSQAKGLSTESITASKLFFPLQGEPLLLRTLRAFQKIPQIREIILAVPPGAESAIRAWGKKYSWLRLKWVQGGKTRAESVWKALKKSDRRNAWVMVHDGARPLIAPAAIKGLFQCMKKDKADGVILARKVISTIKQVPRSQDIIERTIDRNSLYEAETPQLVRRSSLEKAYRTNSRAFEATDESALLESVEARVKVMPHEAWNPKVTTVQDFQLAESYLAQNSRNGVPGKSQSIRVGFGRDTHRLVKGRKLYLGGVRIPFDKGALGHSDGDAFFHAVADAILGALAAGDIGDHFSDKNKRYKGIRSQKIIRTVLDKAKSKGWLPSQVDSVIILEKPKLGGYKNSIRKKMARLLNLDEDSVSVKAKTLEGLGPEGEGLAVTCEALVTLRPDVS